MKSVLRLLCALALAGVLAACSRVTQENYAKIENGMTQDQVYDILGKPTEASSRELLGVTTTSAKWVGSEATVSIQFVNGKVRLRRFDKPQPK